MEPSTVWSDFRRRKSVATTHLFGNSGIIAKLVFLPGLYHLTSQYMSGRKESAKCCTWKDINGYRIEW